MAKPRIAPKDGYDFGAKRQYRRAIWKFFADHCPVPRAEAQCLLMPSSEHDEIDVALSKGFREYNLHVVDFKPQIVAHIKRKYPLVKTYGMSLLRTLLERIEPHTLHVANMDLCSTINYDWAVNAIALSTRMSPEGVVAGTFLRGRDPVISDVINDEIPEFLNSREKIAARFLGVSLHTKSELFPAKSESYQGTSPMGWVAGITYHVVPRFRNKCSCFCPATLSKLEKWLVAHEAIYNFRADAEELANTLLEFGQACGSYSGKGWLNGVEL